MTVSAFAVGLLRLAAIVIPASVAAHTFRTRYLVVSGPVAALADAVLSLSALLVGAEGLGLIGLDRPAALIPLFVVLAVASRVGREPSAKHGAAQPTPAPSMAPAGVRSLWDLRVLPVALGLAVVAAQWCLKTADALGAGMSNFDTLWYHMPFAARFAQTGYVTGIQFTQADPFVAYYPANSELFHAIGILALRGDWLSPLLNLLWLAVALLASWCLGRPWRVERLTLLAGCLAFSLPVLSTTQPGEAFNDVVGLASLLAAAALVANKPDDLRMLAVAGLALGLAAGTKYTFIVPALVMVAAMAVRAPSGERRALLAHLAVPGVLTAGWWYLRDLIRIGNPLGLRFHLGPLALPGPRSPLANALQETVISQISNLSLWGSRFAPGLNHAVGPLWPLVLALGAVAVLGGIVLVKDGVMRVLAVTAVLTGVSYLFLPTGASGIEQGTNLFEVNLRYLTPALVLALVLLPILVRLRAPRALGALGPGLAVVLLATQLEHALWPTQALRHLAFVVVVVVAGAAGSLWRARLLRGRPTTILLTIVAGLLIAVGAAAFEAQRHYFQRRYLVGDRQDRGLGVIYRWAQGVARSRVALYGTVLQYPLYGARDTNYVGYLGEPAPDGGYRPIASCRTWRATIAAGSYRWLVVVTPGPTHPVPISWTEGDPAMRLVLHPEAGAFVFRVIGRPSPSLCPRGPSP
jgi:hypothetical protein